MFLYFGCRSLVWSSYKTFENHMSTKLFWLCGYQLAYVLALYYFIIITITIIILEGKDKSLSAVL